MLFILCATCVVRINMYTHFFLQGSTSVYSRKVEHVYQLVQSTIDFLTQQKQQKNANANGSKSKNGDDDTAGDEVGRLSEASNVFKSCRLHERGVRKPASGAAGKQAACNKSTCMPNTEIDVLGVRQRLVLHDTPLLPFLALHGMRSTIQTKMHCCTAVLYCTVSYPILSTTPVPTLTFHVHLRLHLHTRYCIDMRTVVYVDRYVDVSPSSRTYYGLYLCILS